MNAVHVRAMRRDEIAWAIEQAASEGWNPGLHDARCFAQADAQGFLVAEVDGAPVGCISAVAYGEGFGFIGLYIVLPEWRGRGIGWQLWQAGMQRLGSRVVGLDGVPAQQDNYRRSGFALAWNNMRFAGTTRPASGDALCAPGRIVPLSSIDFATLAADDRRVFPAAREAFLRAWIAQPEAQGRACVDANGKLLGWGLVRRCREGRKIGPLVADAPPVAQALYAALGASAPPGEPLFLDVPLPNADALALAAAQRLQGVFETARMYAGQPPSVELGRVYGVTSFELG